MKKIRQRFTKWYVNHGYTFGFKTCDPFRACWGCPWWVRPLLFLFSPSIYSQIMGESLAKGFEQGIKEAR